MSRKYLKSSLDISEISREKTLQEVKSILGECYDFVKIIDNNSNEILDINHYNENYYMDLPEIMFLVINNNSLRQIKPGCFNSCNNLERIFIDSDILELEENSFIGLSNVNFMDLRIKILKENTLNGLEKLSILYLRNVRYTGYLTIQKNCFNGIQNIKEIYINNLNKIEEGCFNNCESLEILGIYYSSLSLLEKNIFNGLSNVKNINLSNNHYLKYIEPGCFNGCDKLIEINLDNCNLQLLNKNTFSGLTNLRNISLYKNNLIFLNTTSLLPYSNYRVLHNEKHELFDILRSKRTNLDLSHYEYCIKNYGNDNIDNFKKIINIIITI